MAARLSGQHTNRELPASKHHQDKSKIISVCCFDLEEGMLADD